MVKKDRFLKKLIIFRDLWINGTGADKDSVSLDITEAFSHIGAFESVENLKAWGDDEVPNINGLNSMDHHDNMARRLELIPQSCRGNIIRKMLAFMYLQTILGIEKKKNMQMADVQEASELIKNHKNMLGILEEEYYVMMSVIRMIDVMVGNEPFLDFSAKKEPFIRPIEDYLQRVRKYSKM